MLSYSSLRLLESTGQQPVLGLLEMIALVLRVSLPRDAGGWNQQLPSALYVAS